MYISSRLRDMCFKFSLNQLRFSITDNKISRAKIVDKLYKNSHVTNGNLVFWSNYFSRNEKCRIDKN